MSVSDNDLERLRLESRLMSTGGQQSAASWLQVAEALEELQARRQHDATKKQETSE